MKLLIAEDDLTSRMMLQSIAEKWGYQVVVVEDGESAWEELQRPNPPQLLLLDWEMPKLNGMELCQRIRNIETNNPAFIILLTSRDQTADIVDGLQSGANEYISKPFDNAELKVRLEVGCRMLELQIKTEKLTRELEFQASHDNLTGILNRRAIMKTLEKEMNRTARQKEFLLVALCDIDHFKKINDKYGHLAGDEILVEVTSRMKSALRPYDSIGRFGGEEFLMILSVEEDLQLPPLERVRKAIADTPFNIAGTEIDVSISLGFSIFTVANGVAVRESIEVLTAADEALYEAKDSGRNCIAAK